MEDLNENDRYKFGGPDIVRLQEEKMVEKRRRERQFKRTQIEKKRFLSQGQNMLSDDKPMSREDRKLQMALKVINMQEIQEENKKRKEVLAHSELNESKTSWRETEDLSSNERSKTKAREQEIEIESLHLAKKRLSVQPPKKEPMTPFRQTKMDEEEQEPQNNTHLNQKHQLGAERSLLKYIRNYEAEKGSKMIERQHQLGDRLLDRQAQGIEFSQRENGDHGDDKLHNILTGLCDKLNGMDLNQSVKTVLHQLKG